MGPISMLERSLGMDLAAYLSFCFVMSFTPGPNNLMSLAQSRERTFRGALPFLLGLHVSLFSMCTVIYLFIHALEDILPLMDLPLRILGALYLVYLTVRLFMKTEGKRQRPSIPNGSFSPPCS